MDYEDFSILFSLGPGGSIQTRVVSSPVGEGASGFVAPFSGSEIQSFFSRLGRVSGSASPLEASSSTGTSPSLEEFGTQLYRSLFVGEVGRLFHATQGYLGKTPETGIRLKLRLDPREGRLSEVYSTPWEYLYSEHTRSFLALSRRTSVVRYLDVPQPSASVPLPELLRILVVVPNPRDSAQLNLDHERGVICSALERLGERVEVTFLAPATPSALRDELLGSSHHILHFAGHAVAANESRGGAIVLENERGEGVVFDSRQLAETLTGSPSLRLVVLNACETAAVHSQEMFASLASSLVFCGVPAVVANLLPISDKAAVAFAESFYRGLARGLSLDEAVMAGRHSITVLSRNRYEWGVATLFSRLPGNELFATRLAAVASESPVTTAAQAAVRSVASEYRIQAGDARRQGTHGPSAWSDDLTDDVPPADSFSPIRESTTFVLKELEAGYEQARIQAEKWSRASLAAAGLGLAMVILAVCFLLLGEVSSRGV